MTVSSFVCSTKIIFYVPVIPYGALHDSQFVCLLYKNNILRPGKNPMEHYMTVSLFVCSTKIIFYVPVIPYGALYDSQFALQNTSCPGNTLWSIL